MRELDFIETRDIFGGEKRAEIDTKVWRRGSSELSEYLKKDLRTISGEFWGNRQSSCEAEQRIIENNPEKERIESYYRTTQRYLYEGIVWESYKSKQRDFKKIFMLLRKLRVDNVLDFGAGTGGLVRYLFKRGILCDYLDVEGETLDFASWRFRRAGLDVKIIADMNEGPSNYYNAVISDNVFEYLFNLEEIVGEVNRVLKIGGLLIARSSFGGGGAHLRKNDKYSGFDAYDALMTGNGFEYAGQLKDDFFSREVNKYINNYCILKILIKKRRKYGGNFLLHKKVHDTGR